MVDWLENLSPRGRGALLAALVLLIPVAGWLAYSFGEFLGTH